MSKISKLISPHIEEIQKHIDEQKSRLVLLENLIEIANEIEKHPEESPQMIEGCQRYLDLLEKDDKGEAFASQGEPKCDVRSIADVCQDQINKTKSCEDTPSFVLNIIIDLLYKIKTEGNPEVSKCIDTLYNHVNYFGDDVQLILSYGRMREFIKEALVVWDKTYPDGVPAPLVWWEIEYIRKLVSLS